MTLPFWAVEEEEGACLPVLGPAYLGACPLWKEMGEGLVVEVVTGEE